MLHCMIITYHEVSKLCSASTPSTIACFQLRVSQCAIFAANAVQSWVLVGSRATVYDGWCYDNEWLGEAKYLTMQLHLLCTLLLIVHVLQLTIIRSIVHVLRNTFCSKGLFEIVVQFLCEVYNEITEEAASVVREWSAYVISSWFTCAFEGL